jgi:hypothetical protein
MAIIERSPSDGTAVPQPRRSLWRALLWPGREAGPRRTSRVPWVPIAIISVIVIMALFAPLLAPYSPIDQTLRDKLRWGTSPNYRSDRVEPSNGPERNSD